jgi:hypothetical protein
MLEDVKETVVELCHAALEHTDDEQQARLLVAVEQYVDDIGGGHER